MNKKQGNVFEIVSKLKEEHSEEKSWAHKVKSNFNTVVSLDSDCIYWWTNNGDASNDAREYHIPEGLKPHINKAISARLPDIIAEAMKARTEEVGGKMLKHQDSLESLLASIHEITAQE